MADIVVSEFMDEATARTGFDGKDLLFDPSLVDDEPRLLAAVADARALIVRNRTQVRGTLLEQAKNLKVVGRLGVGLDNIDMDACKDRDITVCPATGANDLSVSEYVMTATLMLLRGAYLSTAAVAAGDWPRSALIGREVSGKTLGLVGYGAIARETARRAQALGMTIAAYDPYLPEGDPRWGETRRYTFETLLSASDVISLHTPLTDETRHLIDQSAIDRMKSGAVLINAARGGIVDEKALAAALKSGRIAGAALDVFETEPLSAEAGSLFSGLTNVVLTPHIAGVTEESNLRVSQVTVDNVLRVLDQT